MELGTLETLRERLGGRHPDGSLVISATYASELRWAAGLGGRRFFDVDEVIKYLQKHPERQRPDGCLVAASQPPLATVAAKPYQPSPSEDTHPRAGILGTLDDLRERLGGRRPDGSLVIGATYASKLKVASGHGGSRYFDVDAVIRWRKEHPEFKLENGGPTKHALQSGECYIRTTIPFDCPLCGERVKDEHRCTANAGDKVWPPKPQSRRGRPPRHTLA